MPANIFANFKQPLIRSGFSAGRAALNSSVIRLTWVRLTKLAQSHDMLSN